MNAANLTDVQAALGKGMMTAWHATNAPDRIAIISEHGNRSYSQLNANSNRLVRKLRDAGLVKGDSVALLCRNRPEFVEVLEACHRAGLRFTPINWHLTAEEVSYVVDNCDARAFICDHDCADIGLAVAADNDGLLCKLSTGPGVTGYETYAPAIQDFSGDDISDPSIGGQMLYTSGTTGRPKGVYRRETVVVGSQPNWYLETANFDPSSDVCLVTGPLYHAAPLALNLKLPLLKGIPVVLMDKWDAQLTLKLIDEHKVTHSHMVATMFLRLIELDDSIKQKYDCSSIKWILHGAAPCPVHVKQAMIDWLGPVIYEYYAATEGGGVFIDSQQWLKKPGSVGLPGAAVEYTIFDDDFAPVATGETGTIYFKAPEQGRFEYYKASEKTDDTYHNNHYTMGDRGYVDEDGYLFLTGRSAETIISGGVNIYPQEVDSQIMSHPVVQEVCTIGIPSAEWGEAVHTVIELKTDVLASEALAKEILAFAKTKLPGFKCPKSIAFSDTALPRLPTGKILRRLVREPYWADQEKSI